jgi:hypothetical protein
MRKRGTPQVPRAAGKICIGYCGVKEMRGHENVVTPFLQGAYLACALNHREGQGFCPETGRLNRASLISHFPEASDDSYISVGHKSATTGVA